MLNLFSYWRILIFDILQYGLELSCMELGMGLGRDWDGTRSELGLNWDGTGAELERNWDGTGTGLGQDRDRNRNFETGTGLGIGTSLETWMFHCPKFQSRPSPVPVPSQSCHSSIQLSSNPYCTSGNSWR